MNQTCCHWLVRRDKNHQEILGSYSSCAPCANLAILSFDLNILCYVCIRGPSYIYIYICVYAVYTNLNHLHTDFWCRTSFQPLAPQCDARRHKPMRFKKHDACKWFQSESLKKMYHSHYLWHIYADLIQLSQTGSLKIWSMQLRLKIFSEGLWLMFSWRICHKRWQIEAWLTLRSLLFCLNTRKDE